MLERRSARIAGHGAARDYAARLLESLGAEVGRAPGPADLPAALEWARSGAMSLTGTADGTPRPAPGPLASCARGALEALRALAPWSDALPGDGAALLGERAACFGYARAGRVAPSGSCRLLRCADGWIALNLARDDDRASLPAWLERDADPHTDAWTFAERRVAERSAVDLVARAGWLGLAVAEATSPPDPTPPWHRWRAVGARGARAWDDPRRAPLVLDLSALWAGPLAGELLAAAGARVVKVESVRRPDGARSGPRDFYDLCNGAKPCVALDLGSARGREQLAALVRRADCILESARPRALSQLGLDAEAWLAEAPGRTWVSITGYGREDHPAPGRVAFGDDAGVAAGLALTTGGDDAPLFCGDAIADPLAGLHAAVAAAASLRAGGGHLLDVALRDVTAHAAAFRPSRDEQAALLSCVSPPRARRPARAARPLGADTASILAELGVPC
jgi:crotonobetainyl-CoA:carnitine CoA-transferase CaiB-like acyl-CoA transferase